MGKKVAVFPCPENTASQVEISFYVKREKCGNRKKEADFLREQKKQKEMDEKTREELISIVAKLSAKNSSLSDAVTQMKVKLALYEDNVPDCGAEPKAKKSKKSTKKEKVFAKRKIAIKFSYEGTNYNGYQRSPLANRLATVEDHLFNVMLKCKMIDSIGQSDYIGAARTDKGVHAVNNVLSIVVNSNGTDSDEEERDFVSMMNRHLPRDIVVTAWAPVERDFSARFSCKSRSYTYVFETDGLDVGQMNEAARLLIGQHDYRNLSTAQLERQDTKRECFQARIEPISEGMAALKIEASGFLYHQIRLTMTLLALIGAGLEQPELIEHLLNVEKHPRRPGYKPAQPDGLVLTGCQFEGLEWRVNGRDLANARDKVGERQHTTRIQVWEKLSN